MIITPQPSRRRARASGPDRALVGRLANEAVGFDHPARRVLYTWTTDEQIEELTRSPVLLTRTASPTKGRTFFDRRRDQDRGALARLFDVPALAKRRFAWSNPWATLRGWSDGESYGNRLLRVTLKADAIIAVFNPDARATWRFLDLDGRDVSLGELVLRPERVAAVYHVFEGGQAGGQIAPPFREYVLCNESMIDTWEAGTEQVRADLASELDMLRGLRAELDRAHPDRDPAVGRWSLEMARTTWRGISPTAAVAPLYEACLAFANDRYMLQPDALDEVIEALAAVPAGAPLSHRPNVAFPGFDALPGDCEPLGQEPTAPPTFTWHWPFLDTRGDQPASPTSTWWPWPFPRPFIDTRGDQPASPTSTWWPWPFPRPFIDTRGDQPRDRAPAAASTSTWWPFPRPFIDTRGDQPRDRAPAAASTITWWPWPRLSIEARADQPASPTITWWPFPRPFIDTRGGQSHDRAPAAASTITWWPWPRLFADTLGQPLGQEPAASPTITWWPFPRPFIKES